MGKQFTVAWVGCCIVFCAIANSFRTQNRRQVDSYGDARFRQHRYQRPSLYRRSYEETLARRLRRYEEYEEDDSIKPEQILVSGAVVEDDEDVPLLERIDDKREAPDRGFYDEHKTMLLDLHNVYRSNVTPPASNMEHMEWDDELAYYAQLWADGCVFEHGYPPNTEYGKGLYGQNLYLGHDPTGWKAMWLWYDEYHHYNLKTHYCKPNEQCGHYVQMAWSNANRLGCGITKCNIRRLKWLIVCHYFGPAIVGEQMYAIGIPCSKCPDPRGSLCRNNLCFSWDQCSRLPHLCAQASCVLRCQNCGRLDSNSCKCQCADGFDGSDCSNLCIDQHEKCGKNPGFIDQRTCPSNQNRVATKYCRKMCGSCNGIVPGHVFSHTCCEGKVCDEGYVLDFDGKGCECSLLCPGPKCDAAKSQPPSQNSYYQPPSQNSYYQPPVQNRYDQPTAQNSYYQPPVQNTYNQPPVQNTYNQPPVQNIYNQPPVQNSYNQPPVQNTNNQPPKNNKPTSALSNSSNILNFSGSVNHFILVIIQFCSLVGQWKQIVLQHF